MMLAVWRRARAQEPSTEPTPTAADPTPAPTPDQGMLLRLDLP
jgi:hypothetical protein